MTHSDREMWRINIENDADQACSIYGAAAVDSVFQRYDATCFDDLSPSYYEEVFGDLDRNPYSYWRAAGTYLSAALFVN